LLMIRGLTSMLLVRNQETLDDFTTLEVSPDNRTTLARRADVYSILERYEEVLEELNDLLEINSYD
ncbi:15964_t:CDS:2, partial [Cetraspora pellucida]